MSWLSSSGTSLSLSPSSIFKENDLSNEDRSRGTTLGAPANLVSYESFVRCSTSFANFDFRFIYNCLIIGVSEFIVSTFLSHN